MVGLLQDKSEKYVRDKDVETEMRTGASVSNRRHGSSQGSEKLSSDDVIKKLQTEIDRLKADKGKGRMSPNEEVQRH